MRDLSELNLNDGGEPIDRKSPTSRDIKKFEKKFKVTFPEDYLEFLHFSNGGYPELDLFRSKNCGQVGSWSVNLFFFLDNDRRDECGLWSNTVTWNKHLGINFIPFAEEGGGNPFLFDFTSTPPRIVGCLQEDDFRIVQLASSFSEFIDALELDPDML